MGPFDAHGSVAFTVGSPRERQGEGSSRDVEPTWHDGGGAHSAAADVHTVAPPQGISGPPPEPLPPAEVAAAAATAGRSERDEPARRQSRQRGGAAVDTWRLAGAPSDSRWQVPRPDLTPATQPYPETNGPENPTPIAVPPGSSAADGAAAAKVAREAFVSPAEPSGREAEPPEPPRPIVSERPAASGTIAAATSAPRAEAVAPPEWPRLPRSVQFQALPPLMHETPPARNRFLPTAPTSPGAQAPVVAGGQAHTDAHATVAAVPPPPAKRQARTLPPAAAPPTPTRRVEPATPAATRPAPRHEESPRLTIHRLDVQIVNQPQPPGPALRLPAPAAPGPPDVWDTLDRHHLRNDGLLL